MDTPAPGTADYSIPSSDRLAAMPVEAFIAGWRTITGEPPAILLNSRVAMIALLVASIPVAPFKPPIPPRDGRLAASTTSR